METQKTANSQSNPGKEKWSWKKPSSGDFKLKVMLIYYSQSPRTLKNYTKSTLLMLYKWKDKTRMTTYLYPMVYWIFKAHCWYLPLRKKKRFFSKYYCSFNTHLVTHELWWRCTMRLTLLSLLNTVSILQPVDQGVISTFNFQVLLFSMYIL